MNVRPLHDYVIVYRQEDEKMSTGGIVIPDSVAEKPVRGEIIAVGKGRLLKNGKLIPLGVKPGDQVMFTPYAGTEFKVDGKDMLVMHEKDIIAVIDECVV